MTTSKNYKVFVVEDNEWFNKMLVHCLTQNPDIEVKSFFNGADLLKALHEKPDAITLDYRLPDMNGSALLQQIKAFNPQLEVIMISEQNDIEVAVELLKLGAYDYLIKNTDLNSRLLNNINNLLKRTHLEKRIEYLQEEVEQKFNFSNSIIGQSEVMKKVFSVLEKASASNINVSITGDTGTGKELVAKAIHYNSERKNKPFIAVNMAAIPKELIESELFGYEKGAFTGANEKRKGKFLEANTGTIFLDEIAEMDLAMQSKLLRVLQEREVTPLGSSTPQKIDCKLIIATHENLKKLVDEKRFREDLFFRIMGLNIHLPPLHERDKDVLFIAKKCIEEFCKSNKMPIKSLKEDACKKLLTYPFPGNVRELKSVIEVGIVLADGPEIEAENIIFQHADTLTQVATEEKTMRQYNYEIISLLLKKHGEDIPTVAKILDISSATIYRILKEFSSTQTTA
ncbi:MAG: sigma-54 dependent transcriptional regulator [bacterium]|nr:sigma-54 dependent transcriptional regulator [bacterium]